MGQPVNHGSPEEAVKVCGKPELRAQRRQETHGVRISETVSCDLLAEEGLLSEEVIHVAMVIDAQWPVVREKDVEVLLDLMEDIRLFWVIITLGVD